MRHYPACWNKTLAKLGFRRIFRRQKRRADGFSRFSRVELLESRQMLASDVYLVTTTADDWNSANDGSTLSLREALYKAYIDGSTTDNDVIRFSPNLFASGPATISLTYDSGDGGSQPDPLTINSQVSVEGPGADLLSVSGNRGNVSLQTQVFNVATDVTAEISGLTIKDGWSSQYGGIYSLGNLTLVDSAVLNSFGTVVGGVFAAAGSLEILNSRVDGNSGSYAGVVAAAGSRLTVSGSSISDNTATNFDGGISAIAVPTVQVSGSTIAGNVAGSSGSGGVTIYNATTADIDHSTVSGNSGPVYSGISLTGSIATTATLTNLTVTKNTGGTDRGVQNALSSGTVTLHNSIVAQNSTGNQISGSFSNFSSHNLIGLDSTTVNGIDDGEDNNRVGSVAYPVDARLAPLDYYGGTVKTHALLSDSPALHQADDDLAGSTDQRGHSRQFGFASDIGAFEADNSLVLTVTTLVDRFTPSTTLGDLSLREALYKAEILAGAETIVFDASLFSSGTKTLTLSYNGDSDSNPDRSPSTAA